VNIGDTGKSLGHASYHELPIALKLTATVCARLHNYARLHNKEARQGLLVLPRIPYAADDLLMGNAMSRTIDYGNLMHKAMRSLIQEVLTDVRDKGLPGAHHFFITFDTTHADARLADWLKERYPSEMTVVMQNWYDELEVTDAGFSVTLNFGDAPENLYVPYDSIETFVDPSVEFGLRFEAPEDDEDEDHSDEAPIAEDASSDEDKKSDAEIVSLDSFRK
jgi:hypothetical protein